MQTKPSYGSSNSIPPGAGGTAAAAAPLQQQEETPCVGVANHPPSPFHRHRNYGNSYQGNDHKIKPDLLKLLENKDWHFLMNSMLFNYVDAINRIGILLAWKLN